MLRRLLTRSVLATAVLVLIMGGSAYADDRADQVAVTGEGRATVRPDVMVVRAGVTLLRPDAAAAYEATAETAARLVRAIRGSGVAADDIRTTALSVSPVHDDDDHDKITGYRGSESVTAVVRDLDRAAATLRAVMSAGEGVRIDDLTYRRNDTSKEQAAARAAAFADARRQAVQYAELAGRSLGRVRSIKTSTVQTLADDELPRAAMAYDAAAHLSPGTAELEVTVNVVFALDPAESAEQPEPADQPEPAEADEPTRTR